MKIFGIKFILLIVTVAAVSLRCDAQAWQHYDSLRIQYLQKQDLDSALIFAEKAMLTVKEKTGTEDTLYATLCYYTGFMYKEIGEYKKAESYYTEAKNIREKTLGKDSPGYAEICNGLGLIHKLLGEYSEAEALYKEALVVFSKLYGENNEKYINCLSNLAAFYRAVGKLETAGPLYLKAKDLSGNVNGENSVLYAQCCNGLAVYYEEIGNYTMSEKLYIEAKNIREKLLGKDDPDYALSCSNLAGLYRVMGDYKASEELQIEAKNINAKILGNQHPDYAMSCNNLGLLYTETGNFAAAEPLFVENLEILRNSIGEESQDYATGCHNLALFYQKMGNYPAAEIYYLKAASAIEKSIGKTNATYGTVLFSLASHYHETGNLEKAEPYYEEARQIFENKLGKTHLSYAQVCGNIATFYLDKQEYQKAESLFVEVKKVYVDKIGKENAGYATACGNLAYLYGKMKNYPAAESSFLEAAEIRERILGKEHPSYVKNIFNLGYIYNMDNDLAGAEKYFLSAVTTTNRNVLKNFAFMSEREKELFFQTQLPYYHNFYSFALDRKAQNPGITASVYDNTLRIKGLLLKSSTALRSAVLKSSDTSLVRVYNEWIALKKEISALYSVEVSKRKKYPATLEQKANEMEKELVSRSMAFTDFEKMQRITWDSVRKNLKPGEAAIEFINFTRKGNKDSVLYAALIITPDSKEPEMVPLFYEKILEAILSKYSGNNSAYVSSVYGTASDPTVQLYDLIWKPLEGYLSGIKTIHLSPGGLLHKVSFAAIAKGKNVLLCDAYNIDVESSTAKVALPDYFKPDKGFTATIFGGINYNAENNGEEVWNYLEGTRLEAENIQKLLLKNKVKTEILTGNTTTEKNLKDIASKSDILHIATHGFFYPDPREGRATGGETAGEVTFRGGRGTRGFGVWGFVKNPNPMMRSGLAFAGANRVWADQYVNGESDGVLTADEVVNIDMRNTGLVVLSACETGLGDIRGSEGVYGLQRAFKMAGVKYIIMSLWQVPDKETVEFMKMFYKKLFKSKDVRLAFNETQKEMRKKYDPYYWAAFVLVE